ncbi:MAG: hypothetical protein AAGC95_13450, partial [Pseudomonadota bacterium]
SELFRHPGRYTRPKPIGFGVRVLAPGSVSACLKSVAPDPGSLDFLTKSKIWRKPASGMTRYIDEPQQALKRLFFNRNQAGALSLCFFAFPDGQPYTLDLEML